jgi:hypothetical protein
VLGAGSTCSTSARTAHDVDDRPGTRANSRRTPVRRRRSEPCVRISRAGAALATGLPGAPPFARARSREWLPGREAEVRHARHLVRQRDGDAGAAEENHRDQVAHRGRGCRRAFGDPGPFAELLSTIGSGVGALVNDAAPRRRYGAHRPGARAPRRPVSCRSSWRVRGVGRNDRCPLPLRPRGAPEQERRSSTPQV